MKDLWVSRGAQHDWDEYGDQVARYQPWRGLAARWRAWRQPRPHPVTGDLLTPSERLIWAVMGQYRKLRWLLLLQAVTVVWWLRPGWFPGGLFGWNLAWSDLAVVVEELAGIAFLAQMFRDAQIIRSELRELREETRLQRESLALLAEVHAVVVRKDPP